MNYFLPFRSIHSVTNGNIFMAEQYSTGVRKQTLGGHKQNPVGTKTQEKGTIIPQETEPGLPVSVQKSPAEAEVDSGLPWCQGH